jgi:hypothetical protein
MPAQTLIALLAGAVVALGLFAMLSKLVNVEFKVSVSDVRRISQEIHELVGRWMSGNYSGDPSQLASAVAGLLPQAREIAQRESAKIDDHVVRLMVANAIAAHRIATLGEAQAACDEALQLEQRAA